MKSGDNCPVCPLGVLYVVNSIRRGDFREQHLRCDMCGKRVGKCVVPESSIRHRRKPGCAVKH